MRVSDKKGISLENLLQIPSDPCKFDKIDAKMMMRRKKLGMYIIKGEVGTSKGQRIWYVS